MAPARVTVPASRPTPRADQAFPRRGGLHIESAEVGPVIRRWTLLVTATALLGAAAPAVATTTLERTIKVAGGEGFRPLEAGPGEAHKVREGLGRAKGGRTKRRRSLVNFVQMTDPQIADEMSPGRIELFDPAGGDLSAAWRPQEALGTQVLDQTVRSVNDNQTSPVKQGGNRGRSRLGFAIQTGDQPDNQQLNETEWYLSVLEGGEVSPFSGQPVSDSNPCPGASPETVARLDADVAARRYTGVQDYEDYPDVPPSRYEGFWDPDQAVPGGPYAAFPRYEGLMERAQQAFTAEGLELPWYTTRGNHDGLIQGNIPANAELFTGLVVGCNKVFPNADFDPASLVGVSGSQLAEEFENPATLAALFAGFRTVPPDPTRRFLSIQEYKQLHAGADHAHGYGYVSDSQNRASADNASYYSFSPAGGTRFIALDTVAQGGGASGNIDDPQYKWLSKELDNNSAVSYSSNGKLRRDGDKNRLIFVYAHHTIGTMNNPDPDEDAGPCTVPPLPGCDSDPRDSAPIHRGDKGKQSLESLLLRYPNVVAFVSGHTHHNRIERFKGSNSKSGFWQVNTSSHVDFPQQSRLIELMDNGDGTLSLFGTVIDSAAPIETPPPGPAANLTNEEMASLSRRLAANDPQRDFVTDRYEGGTGKRKDRNVELLIRDPRLLAK